MQSLIHATARRSCSSFTTRRRLIRTTGKVSSKWPQSRLVVIFCSQTNLAVTRESQTNDALSTLRPANWKRDFSSSKAGTPTVVTANRATTPVAITTTTPLELPAAGVAADVVVRETPEMNTITTVAKVQPLPLQKLYRYLDLEYFTEDELSIVFDKMRLSSQNNGYKENHYPDQLLVTQVEDYLLQRWLSLEMKEQQGDDGQATESQKAIKRQYAATEASQLMSLFESKEKHDDGSVDPATIRVTTSVSREKFCSTILAKASAVDLQSTWPITVSMLIVGASVGVITPAMPFVVQELSLSTAQYGAVVSAFALAKMAANIPAAVAVERHGRKPYMTFSMALIAAGVGGVGLAGSFEELYFCRLLTGLGVSALSTAATLMITDLSTPLNRASTMAPIMSAFSAGTALGPALGGSMVDSLGLQSTFATVGVSYLGVALLNRAILSETQPAKSEVPWKQPSNDKNGSEGMWTSAVGQWGPLVRIPAIRQVLLMNGFYWVALAGSQMTLLPLLLTNSLHMTATQVGQVYMGMSVVQIVGNPVFASVMDRMGKAPAIVAGCTLIAGSMAALPYCQDSYHLAATLGCWSMGSSMLSTAPVAHLSDQVPSAQRAQAIALLRTFGDVGFLIGAAGTGVLADYMGSLEGALLSSSGLLLTATLWFATRQQLLQHSTDAASSHKAKDTKR